MIGGALRELARVASYPATGYWLGRRAWDPAALDVDLIAGESGKLWFDRRAQAAHAAPWTRCDRAEGQRLWDHCAALCGLPAELGATP